jgi:cytochrome P450
MLRGIGLMRRDPPQFLAQCVERFGPVVAFPIPRATVLYLADPADVRRVLQSNHTAYGKRTAQYDALALVTGSGLLASDGDLWRRMRRILQPAFHRTLIDQMAGAIQQPTERLRARWSGRADDEPIDIDQEMLELMLEVVGTTVFGADFGHESASLVNAVMSALHVVVSKSQQPLSLPEWLPTPSNRRLAHSLNKLNEAVAGLIVARRSTPLGDDALSLLLIARDAGLASDEEVRDEVVTLIVAGHETVAATLTWTWQLVASNRDVEGRLHAEVDALPDGPWEAAVLDRLTYTRAVIDECLRLYPPAWVMTRRSLSPDVLSGHSVPASTTLIMSPYLLHRDTALWEAPDRFDPNRFLSPKRDLVDRSTYLPFGAGPRLCIGRELSLFEEPLIVARRFIVRPSKPQSVVRDFGVTLRPAHGLPANIHRR